MVATVRPYNITWELLPEDFILDEIVDNLYSPYIAAVLTESLELAGGLPSTALLTTNYGICATVNDKEVIVKAPDWAYAPKISVAREEVKRSYTPN